MTRLLLWTTIIVLAICPALAQAPAAATITIGVTGTLGPILQGTDPLKLNGRTGTLTVMVSESATPVISNAQLAVYALPAGAVTVVIGNQPFTTATPSKLTIKLGSNADTLSVVYRGQDSTTNRFIASIAPGSYSTAALMHATPFSPSPQSLTPATAAAGPGSQVWYSSQGVLTVLGFTGSASNSAASTAALPELGPEL